MRIFALVSIIFGLCAGAVLAEPALTPRATPAVTSDTAPANDEVGCRLRLKALARAGELTFEVRSTSIAPRARPLIAPLVDAALACGQHKLEIAGHASDGVTERERQDLAFDRASRVLTILMRNGFSRDDAVVIGYGANRPVVALDTPETLDRNNRVSISLLIDSPVFQRAMPNS